MGTFTAGQLAQKTSVNVETIRFYERRKLLLKPKKSKSGYRQYSESDVVRILFIKRAKELGFTLSEISELLSLKLDSKTTCGDVKKLSENKLADVEERIRDLQRIKKKLEELITLCEQENASTSECPILEALEPQV